MVCKATSLGMLYLMNMIFFVPQVLIEQIYYDESMPPSYDDYIDESGFGRVSTLGNDPTILEGVESYCDNHESGFGEVMTLFSDESTILEEVPIDYENKVAIYDDYCDDMYDIKNKDNHETVGERSRNSKFSMHHQDQSME